MRSNRARIAALHYQGPGRGPLAGGSVAPRLCTPRATTTTNMWIQTALRCRVSSKRILRARIDARWQGAGVSVRRYNS
jgi:hypothetical protein